MERVQKLSDVWHKATWKVIEFKNPGFENIRTLFKDTYEIIEEYSKEKLVPKELTGMLLEMYEFGWWVSDLDDTPLHRYYQEIVSVVKDLNKYFLTRDANVESIKNTIERIGE